MQDSLSNTLVILASFFTVNNHSFFFFQVFFSPIEIRFLRGLSIHPKYCKHGFDCMVFSKLMKKNLQKHKQFNLPWKFAPWINNDKKFYTLPIKKYQMKKLILSFTLQNYPCLQYAFFNNRNKQNKPSVRMFSLIIYSIIMELPVNIDYRRSCTIQKHTANIY